MKDRARALRKSIGDQQTIFQINRLRDNIQINELEREGYHNNDTEKIHRVISTYLKKTWCLPTN